jgi:hypothetical protein
MQLLKIGHCASRLLSGPPIHQFVSTGHTGACVLSMMRHTTERDRGLPTILDKSLDVETGKE